MYSRGLLSIASYLKKNLGISIDYVSYNDYNLDILNKLNEEIGGQDMRSAFDFAPFRRSTVGFDRLFDMLENSSASQTQENYPPFDLIKLGDNEYRIELAVAGFKPGEIDITAQQNVLLVSGKKSEESENRGQDYVYRGIATRSFERRFALADHIQVRGADLKDGLLAIELVREIPEAMKPRKIDIGGTKERSAIGGGDKPASQQTVEAEAEHA
jgi:molecular chaperone IbpA